jgi:hypothetical protein
MLRKNSTYAVASARGMRRGVVRSTPRIEPSVKAMTQAASETMRVHIVPEASHPRYVMPPDGAFWRRTDQSTARRRRSDEGQSGSAFMAQVFCRSALIGRLSDSPEGSFSVNHLA